MRRGFTFYFKIIILLIVAAYFVYCAVTPNAWHFLDNVDLLIHEAGHIVFMPFGEFVCVAGGTIMQILMPLAFVIYFLRENELYSNSFVMFWLGQNFINISVYLKDAVEMRLPLLGGGGTHDWNFLLTRLNLLPQTQFLGSLVYLSGLAIIILAVFLGFYAVIKKDNQDARSTFTP